MVSCQIIKGENLFTIEFTPGNPNFDYWLSKKIDWARWRRKDEKGITLVCDDATKEEALYVEKLVKASQQTGDRIDFRIVEKIKAEMEQEERSETEIPPSISEPAPPTIRLPQKQLTLF